MSVNYNECVLPFHRSCILNWVTEHFPDFEGSQVDDRVSGLVRVLVTGGHEFIQ